MMSIFYQWILWLMSLFFCTRELKMILSIVTTLEPRAQRLLFRGKEREDDDCLHMIGVKDMDKVLLLEDPAIKERKSHALARNQAIGNPSHTITV